MWPFNRRDFGLSATAMVAERTAGRTGSMSSRISRERALRNSAVWACLRLRADLLSLMPVDVYRNIGGIAYEQAKPPIFVNPDGKKQTWTEFVWATQFDLDSVGNTVGVITARDGLRLPAVIELAHADEVTFTGKGSQLEKIRIGKDTYEPEDIWHEKQYAIAGCPVGLSPIAYAARAVNGYLSAQQFTDEWFSNSTVPGGHLKNVNKKLDKTEAAETKEAFKTTVQSGDVWVSGNDWEYSMLSAKASESAFLEVMKFSLPEVCRFLGVPGDMIDAPPDARRSSVTYANITQRNLQLLIMNLGPAIRRREEKWSGQLLPQPRFAKLNRGVLLEMDLASRYAAHGVGIDKRFLAPSEARAHENLPPFTPDQLAEFAVLFPKGPTSPDPQGVQS